MNIKCSEIYCNDIGATKFERSIYLTMRYLHVFASDENYKFSKAYINFIENKFNNEEHRFLFNEMVDLFEYIFRFFRNKQILFLLAEVKI